MAEEESISCARVTSSVSGEPESETPAPTESSKQEVTRMSVRPGQKAPDFTAPAYHKGSFTSVKLSDFAGKWVW